MAWIAPGYVNAAMLATTVLSPDALTHRLPLAPLPGMRGKLREALHSDALPAGRSDAPMPLRSPGKRPELSLQARGAKHGAELRGAS